MEDRSDDRPDATVSVTRLAPAGRPPVVAVLAATLLVAAAIVKPWGEPGRPSPTAPLAIAPTATPAASPTIDPAVDELQEHCLWPGGWRVFSHERTNRGSLRAWKSLEPATDATGPLDESLPVVMVAARRIPGLGYCAPAFGDLPPGDSRLAIWRVTSGDAVSPVRGRLLLPKRPSAGGGLWAPGSPEDGGWDEGRYVFALRGDGYERWWAVDVVLTGGRRR